MKEERKQAHNLLAKLLDAGYVSTEQFYAEAIKPDFPDEMLFELTLADNPDNEGKTFSQEGIEGIVDQIQAFVLARVMAFWKHHDKPARTMRIAMAIGLGSGSSDPEDIKKEGMPFYIRQDAGGLTQVDGKHRIARKPLDK